MKTTKASTCAVVSEDQPRLANIRAHRCCLPALTGAASKAQPVSTTYPAGLDLYPVLPVNIPSKNSSVASEKFALPLRPNRSTNTRENPNVASINIPTINEYALQLPLQPAGSFPTRPRTKPCANACTCTNSTSTVPSTAFGLHACCQKPPAHQTSVNPCLASLCFP